MRLKNILLQNRLSFFLLAVVLLLALLPGLSSASLGTFRAGDCISIRVLANCSSINITEVNDGNITFILNTNMTKLGGQTFSYNFCNTTNIGIYSYSWNNRCIDCSLGNCGHSFEVTPTGKVFTIEKAVTYLLIFIVSFLIFIGLLVVGISIEGSNNTDEMTGYVIAVSNIKYVKMFALALAYLISVFISYFVWMVSYAYLDMDFLSNIFRFIFTAQVVLIVPLFILSVYILIINKVRDSKISELLSRGLTVKNGEY